MAHNLYDDNEYVHNLLNGLNINELKEILTFMKAVKYGEKQLLRERIIRVLDSSTTTTKNLRKKIVQVYESRTQKPSETLKKSPTTARLRKQHHPATIDQSTSCVNTSITDIPDTETTQSELSPFFRQIKKILDPIHFGNNIYDGHYTGRFYLKHDFRTSIRESWSDLERTYKTIVILRFAQIYPEETEENTNKKRLPYNLTVCVNGEECQLPTLNVPESRTLNRRWRRNIPIDITQETILTNILSNEIKITWFQDPHQYIASIYLVEKVTPEELLEKLKEKPPRKYERTKEMIQNSMESDSSMYVHSIYITLQDPLSYTRMKLPVRGVHCIHLQCFDALQFLKLNNNNQTWACPICRKNVELEDIEVDEYFLHILQSPNLSEECENVILLKDGSWSEKKRKFSNSSLSNSSSNKKVLEFELSSSDTDDENSSSTMNPLK